MATAAAPAAALFLVPSLSPLHSSKPILPAPRSSPHPLCLPRHSFRPLAVHHLLRRRRLRQRDVSAAADNGDDGDDVAAVEDYGVADDEEAEELDNKKDYDVEYFGTVAGPGAAMASAESDDIEMIAAESFVSTRGWESETVVGYRINEEEFHKISLFHCDFFIRRPPDPDGNVFDFREMYVTPPDTDVYSIPRVLAPLPQKYIRCVKRNYGLYNVTEPPIDAPRDPFYKSQREIYKVFLMKHYRNMRVSDPDFFIDFEEVYVIDSKTKSITRAKVVVTIPEGRSRDRSNDLLIVRDKGTTFKIIDKSKRDTPTDVIEREDWVKTRQEMENHLMKLRDFNVSNWF